MVVGAALAGAVELARRRRAARANAAIDRATRSLAQALAASLAAGNSVHGALAAAPASVDAPLRPHLERAARELALGYALDGVLERLTERAGAPRLRVIVGALIMQRRAGGDLVRLLGELAESFRRDDQALDQARSATTQARLTAWIVIGAPLGVALMAELVWPGALTGVLAAPAALMVFVLALAMHGVGAWLVVRLAGVRA
jgi:tight adherence protein B